METLIYASPLRDIYREMDSSCVSLTHKVWYEITDRCDVKGVRLIDNSNLPHWVSKRKVAISERVNGPVVSHPGPLNICSRPHYEIGVLLRANKDICEDLDVIFTGGEIYSIIDMTVGGNVPLVFSNDGTVIVMSVALSKSFSIVPSLD